MVVVLVVDLQVCVRRFALPVADELERTRLSTWFALDGVLENVDIEV